MKKIYSIIGLLALTFTVNAQNANKTSTIKAAHAIGNPVLGVTTSTTTLLIPNSIGGASTTCSLTTYTGGADGYVAGTNTYGDLEKAQKYDLTTYSLTTPATVGAAGVFFTVADDGGTSANVTVKVYANTAGKPGTLLGTSLPVALSSIVTGTITPFMFSTPVALTGNLFHMSVDISGLDATAGDSVAIAQTDDGCADNTVDGANEKFSDNSWHSMTETPASWGFASTDLAIFPQVTADMVTGLKKQSVNSFVTVSPNPSNGLFNLTLKSAISENVSVVVTNAIGQTVINKNFNSSESISFDLSNQNNGVYFVSITNGADKMIKKVVLSK